MPRVLCSVMGIWGFGSGLAHVYPEAEEQRCWNHRILNVLDKLPKKRQAEAKGLLCQIPPMRPRSKAQPQSATLTINANSAPNHAPPGRRQCSISVFISKIIEQPSAAVNQQTRLIAASTRSSATVIQRRGRARNTPKQPQFVDEIPRSRVVTLTVQKPGDLACAFKDGA